MAQQRPLKTNPLFAIWLNDGLCDEAIMEYKINPDFWLKLRPIFPEIRLRNPAPSKWTKVNKQNYKFNKALIGCGTCEYRKTEILKDHCKECAHSGNVIDQNGQVT